MYRHSLLLFLMLLISGLHAQSDSSFSVTLKEYIAPGAKTIFTFSPGGELQAFRKKRGVKQRGKTLMTAEVNSSQAREESILYTYLKNEESIAGHTITVKDGMPGKLEVVKTTGSEAVVLRSSNYELDDEGRPVRMVLREYNPKKGPSSVSTTTYTYQWAADGSLEIKSDALTAVRYKVKVKKQSLIIDRKEAKTAWVRETYRYSKEGLLQLVSISTASNPNNAITRIMYYEHGFVKAAQKQPLTTAVNLDNTKFLWSIKKEEVAAIPKNVARKASSCITESLLLAPTNYALLFPPQLRAASFPGVLAKK